MSAAVLTELDAALQQSPREQGLPMNNWSSPALCRHLEEKYGIRLSPDQALRIMRKLEFRQVRPRPRLAKGDPEAKGEPGGVSAACNGTGRRAGA